jgi:tetratricopeptide (TPR) repeat protein
MNGIRTALVLSLALVLISIPGVGYCQSAEEWLAKARDETDPQIQIEYFSRAIRLNPDLGEAYSGRGTANSELGRYDSAVADYTKAIGLNPDIAQTYNNRGWAYEQLGKYDKAVADFTAAIRIDSHYANAYNNRGVAYYGLGMVEKALADFDKACKLGYPKGCENYYKVK